MAGAHLLDDTEDGDAQAEEGAEHDRQGRIFLDAAELADEQYAGDA